MKARHGVVAAWYGALFSWCAMPLFSCRSSAPDPPEGSGIPAHSVREAAVTNAPPAKTPDNYVIAFIGDQGTGEDAEAVLRSVGARPAHVFGQRLPR